MPQPEDFPDLPLEVVDKREIGTRYHCAIGTVDGTKLYGYLLDPAQQDAFSQITDVLTRDRLIQAGSPNLTDRDLTAFPRVTDGNFAGGQNQITFLDATKYWDGDLDIQEPGYAKLRAEWLQTTFIGGEASGRDPQITQGFGNPGNFSQKAYIAYGPVVGAADPAIYCSDGSVIITPTDPLMVQGDPSGLYYGDNFGDLYFLREQGDTWYKIGQNALNGDFWVVDQGTAGLWLYYNKIIYASGPDADQYVLWKIDLSAVVNLVAPGVETGVQVAFGAEVRYATDITGYASGVAILINTPEGCQVWNHDGTAATLLMEIPGYQSLGLCVVLGSIYVTLNSISGYAASLLAGITGTQLTILSQFGRANMLDKTRLGAAHGGEFRVYFVIEKASNNKIIGQFDVRSAAVSRDQQYIQYFDNPPMGHRGIVSFGDQAYAFAQYCPAAGNGTDGPIQLNSKATANIIATGIPPLPYRDQIMADLPIHYYRMNGAGFGTEIDLGSGLDNLTYDNSMTSFRFTSVPGMLGSTGDNDAAAMLSGSNGNSLQGLRNADGFGADFNGDFMIEFGMMFAPSLKVQSDSGGPGSIQLILWGSEATFGRTTVELVSQGVDGGAPFVLRISFGSTFAVDVPITDYFDGQRHLVQILHFDTVEVDVFVDDVQIFTQAIFVGALNILRRHHVAIGPYSDVAWSGQSRFNGQWLELDEVSIHSAGGMTPTRRADHYLSWAPPDPVVPRSEPYGSLTSSRIDFNTPSLHKLIRRVTATHSPLLTGQQMQLTAYLDQDPSDLSGASIIGTPNTVAGSTETVLTMPLNTQAKTIVFVARLTGNPGNARSSPVLNHVAIEATTPFVWELKLALSHKRQDLRDREDTLTQGVKAADLKHLLDFIWLSGEYAVFVDPDRLTWNVTIENYQFTSKSPKRESTNLTEADLEGVAVVKLRALPG